MRVEQERCDRRRSVVVGVCVGACIALVMHARTAEPKVFAAAWVDSEVDELLVNPCTETGGANLAGPALGHVDVEQQPRDGCREQLHGNAGAEGRRCGQLYRAMRAGGDRGNSAQSSFTGRGDRARVKRVLPEVHPVIDSGDDQVRTAGEDAGAGVERDVDAIGRGAVEGEDAWLNAAQP